MKNKKQKSVLQKKIEGKINYRKRKLKLKRDEFEKFTNNNPDKRLKVKAWREMDSGVKKGKIYKYTRIYSAILNEATKINTNIADLSLKLKRFKKQKELNIALKKGERREFIGSAWDTRDIDNAVLNDQNIKSVNGINTRKDKDDVVYLINQLKLKMSSKDQLVLVYDKLGISKLFIADNDYLDEIETNKRKDKKKK